MGRQSGRKREKRAAKTANARGVTPPAEAVGYGVRIADYFVRQVRQSDVELDACSLRVILVRSEISVEVALLVN